MQQDSVPAGTDSPFPIQVAQAPPSGAVPIGTVSELSGSASVTRDGSTQALAVGDPVFQDDLVATQPGASLTITFVDETVFSLSGDARLVLDQLIFNPGGSGNQLILSLAKGTFAFVSGAISDNEGPGLRIDTPVGTIGVRGTAGVGDFDLVRLLITLLQGSIGFSNNVAAALLTDVFQTLNVGSANQSDLTVFEMTEAEQAVYDFLLPQILERVEPEAGEQTLPDGDGADGGGGVGIERAGADEQDGDDNDGRLAEREQAREALRELLAEAQAIAEDILDELAAAQAEDPNLLTTAMPMEDVDSGEPSDDGAPDLPDVDPVDFSFEAGFGSWATDTGNASIETAAFMSGPTHLLQQALLTTGAGAQSAAAIETLLGLSAGAFDGLGNGVTTEGSVIAGEFALMADDMLSFDVNFLTDEIPAPGEVNDFAFLVFDGMLQEIADTTSPLVPSATILVDETGFMNVKVTAPTDGTFTFAVGVMDASDTAFDSAILVDNFVVTPAEEIIITA